MALKDGEKAAVVQRDRETYGVAPHVPCGVVTPELLRRLADVAEKHGCPAMKITGAARIALLGFREEQIDAVWQDLGMAPGHLTGTRVRSVKACPGTEYCKRARQGSLKVGLQLDRLHHGRELPGKLKIGVSGCGHQCAETSVKDIGLVGFPKGWKLLVGGMAGGQTRVAEELFRELSDDEALRAVAHVIDYFAQHATTHQRLGRLIDRVGLDALRQYVLAREPGLRGATAAWEAAVASE